MLKKTIADSPAVDALERLFDLAHGHSGQCRHVAAFLLGLYDGARFSFDLTEMRCVDTKIFNDMLTVLKLDNQPTREVHDYFENGGAAFEALAVRYRIADRLLLRSVI